MRFDQINHILEIAKLGSINKAAKSLSMTQPNLSLSIKSLENEVGFKIFDRTRRGVEVTEKGYKLLEHAKSINSSYKAINYLANNELPDDRTVKLSISAQYVSRTFYSLVELYKKNNNSSLDFSIKQTDFNKTIEDVVSEKSDIGILTIDTAQDDIVKNVLSINGLEYKSIESGKIYAYLSKDHPLSNREFVKVSELFKYPLVTFTFTNKEYLYSRVLAKTETHKFKQKFQVDDYFFMTYLLIQLNAVAFTVKFPNIKPMLKTDLFNFELKEIPIEDDIEFNLGYIKRIDKPLSTVCLDFLSILEEKLITN